MNGRPFLFFYGCCLMFLVVFSSPLQARPFSPIVSVASVSEGPYSHGKKKFILSATLFFRAPAAPSIRSSPLAHFSIFLRVRLPLPAARGDSSQKKKKLDFCCTFSFQNPSALFAFRRLLLWYVNFSPSCLQKHSLPLHCLYLFVTHR